MKFTKNNIIKNEFWVFITARSGSKTIKNKNIKLLNGLPLVAYSLITARKLRFVKKIVFTSDSKKYHELSRKYAQLENHLRSKKTSTDKATDYEVFKEYIYEKIKKNEKIPEFFIHLRPTTPIRKVKTLEKIYKYFIKNKKKFSSLRSVSKLENSGYRTVLIKNKKLYSLYYKSFKLEIINRPRQVFPETFIPNGYCDIVKSKNILMGFLHGSSVGTYIINEFNSDMDNLEEFKNTEKYLKK